MKNPLKEELQISSRAFSRERLPKVVFGGLPKFDIFEFPFGPPSEELNTFPKLDIIENDTGFYYFFEIPGIPKEKIELSVNEDTITVSGERNVDFNEEKDNFVILERKMGKFSRTIALPKDSDISKTEASLRDGVLKISVPKKEESGNQKIEIK